METKHYSAIEFRRLTGSFEGVHDAAGDRSRPALASHYFDFLDEEAVKIKNDELSRAPELIRNIPLAQVGFSPPRLQSGWGERCCARTSRNTFTFAASALTVLAQSISAFEDFQDVLAIGVSLRPHAAGTRKNTRSAVALA
jgi:hypothetical protein